MANPEVRIPFHKAWLAQEGLDFEWMRGIQEDFLDDPSAPWNDGSQFPGLTADGAVLDELCTRAEFGLVPQLSGEEIAALKRVVAKFLRRGRPGAPDKIERDAWIALSLRVFRDRKKSTLEKGKDAIVEASNGRVRRDSVDRAWRRFGKPAKAAHVTWESSDD